MLFDVVKGKKELGYYEISIEASDSKLITKSNGVADKVNFFVDKEITYIQDGYKQIVFKKNQKIESFEIKTKLSIIDKATKKEYDRKLKKVKQDSMLLITKTGKKRIELFNKRKIIIKTLDEVVADIVNEKVTYDKFILFDKLGVMKMVAKIVKNANGYTIVNSTKKKDYIGITTKNNVPQEIKSLVSNWKLTLINSGVYKEYTIDILSSLKDNIGEFIGSDLEAAKFTLSSKMKTTKKHYLLKADLNLALPASQEAKKDYEKAKFCKTLLKKNGLKHQKIAIKNNSCVTQVNLKIDRKKYNKKIVNRLYQEHKQLKLSKKIKITKSSIKYKLL